MTFDGDTTDTSKIWVPGEPQARDSSGNIVDAPSAPTVDADENMNDHGQMEQVVDQQQENMETQKNDDPDATTEESDPAEKPED